MFARSNSTKTQTSTQNLATPAGSRLWFSPQKRDNWCWAACCSMALAIKGAPRQQCAVASSYFAPQSCCGGGCDAACTLADVLDVFQRNGLTSAQGQGLPLKSSDDLKAALQQGPVAAGLRGQVTNHMILVYGYSVNADGAALFNVADPAKAGVGVMTFDELQQSNGSWTWSWTWTGLR
jgi:Papain-like cysteine protease AvrRpt2